MHHIHCLTRFWVVLLLLSSSVFAESGPSKNKKTFLLSMFTAQDSKQGQMLTEIYHELFQRVNISVDIEPFPMRRASVQADRGKIDGEAARIATYSDLYPNMRQVDFPMVQVVFVTYARRSAQLRLKDGWESLINSKLRIGYLAGVVYTENMLIDNVSWSRLDESRTSEQGLSKLLHGRTDVFVYLRGYYMEDESLNESTEVISTLQVVPLYLHVHKRHEKLIPELIKTLKTMKKEGRLLDICRQIYQKDSSDHCLTKGGKYSQLQF